MRKLKPTYKSETLKSRERQRNSYFHFTIDSQRYESQAILQQPAFPGMLDFDYNEILYRKQFHFGCNNFALFNQQTHETHRFT